MKLSQEEIIRGDKLISEFMGCKYHEFFNSGYSIMHVIDRIESLQSEGEKLYYFILVSDTAIFSDLDTHSEIVYINYGGSRLKSIWLAIVEFIKWYRITIELKTTIDITEYDFWDITLDSSEIDYIVKALSIELRALTKKENLSIDHIYGHIDDTTGKIIVEASYDYNEELLTTFVFKQINYDSPLFTVEKIEPI